MISSAFKKYAKENGMIVANGYAHGVFRGYDVAFFDGMGTKSVSICGFWKNEEKRDALIERMNSMDLEKQYHVQAFLVLESGMVIVFTDNFGMMKLITQFIDFLMPILPEYELKGAGVCPYCGQPLSSEDTWKLFDSIPVHCHASCLSKVQMEAERDEEQKWELNESDINTSVGQGVIGAVLGALVGSMIWIIALALGFYFSAIGYLIGRFSLRGYDMAKGKRGKGCIITVILTSIGGVLVGQLGGSLASLLVAMRKIPDAKISDLSWMIPALFEEPGFVRTFNANMFLGFFFALLGLSAILMEMRRDNTKKKFKVRDI